MKKVLLLVIFISGVAFAQFKANLDKPQDVNSGMIKKENLSDSFLGLFNPENFSMHQSLSMSYSTFGGSYMALGVYRNNLSYKFSDALSVQVEASILNTPANSFGRDFSKSLNGIYLTRALLDYKISDNSRISVEYRMMPMGMGYYSPYGLSPYSGYGSFGRFGYGNNYFWDE